MGRGSQGENDEGNQAGAARKKRISEINEEHVHSQAYGCTYKTYRILSILLNIAVRQCARPRLLPQKKSGSTGLKIHLSFFWFVR